MSELGLEFGSSHVRVRLGFNLVKGTDLSFRIFPAELQRKRLVNSNSVICRLTFLASLVLFKQLSVPFADPFLALVAPGMNYMNRNRPSGMLPDTIRGARSRLTFASGA